MRNFAKKLDNYIYYMLLFTVAIIPLKQELTAFCVAVTFLCAAFVAVAGDKKRRPAVLSNWEQGLLYALVALGVVSLHFSLDTFISSWNFVYVAGQYGALLFVLFRYGWQLPRPFVRSSDGETIAASETVGFDGVAEEQGVKGWARCFKSLPRPMQLIGAFLVMSVFVSSLGIMQKVLGVTAEGIWVDPDQFPDLKVRVFSTLVNPNILAGYLVLVVAYVTAFFNVSKGRKYLRLVLAATGILACVCLLYTYSRGNWLACAAVLLCFCALFNRRALLPVAGGGLLALLLGGQAVLHRLSSITSGEDTSAALRVAYLQSTLTMIEDFPFGVGWHGYRFMYPDYNFYLADTSVIMYHCHNIFLNVFVELGIQGLIVFLLVWGMFFRAAWQLAKQGKSLWLQGMGQGYVLASIGIAVGGLTDHVYFNTQMGLLFWLLGGIIMLCRRLNAYEQ